MAAPARSPDSERRRLAKQPLGIDGLVQRLIELDQQADRRRRRQERLSRLWRWLRSALRGRSASAAGGRETGGSGQPEAWPEPRQAGDWRAPGPATQAEQRAQAGYSEPVSQAMARLEDRIRNLPHPLGGAFENAVRERFETDKKFQDKFQRHPERYPTFAKYLNKATVSESVRMAPLDPPRGKERAEVLGALTPEERVKAEWAEVRRALSSAEWAEALEAERRTALGQALTSVGPEPQAEAPGGAQLNEGLRTPEQLAQAERVAWAEALTSVGPEPQAEAPGGAERFVRSAQQAGEPPQVPTEGDRIAAGFPVRLPGGSENDHLTAAEKGISEELDRANEVLAEIDRRMSKAAGVDPIPAARLGAPGASGAAVGDFAPHEAEVRLRATAPEATQESNATGDLPMKNSADSPSSSSPALLVEVRAYMFPGTNYRPSNGSEPSRPAVDQQSSKALGKGPGTGR